MGWRSVMITQPAYLSLGLNALQIRQGEQQVQVPLEDLSVIVIDNPQVTLTSQLLSACAGHQITVVTVGQDHHPNGVYLPFLPHSRALKVMRAQLALGLPARKQLHRQLVQQKIRNQAAALVAVGESDTALHLYNMASEVRSGDSGNREAQAAQLYFRALFGSGFSRPQNRFYNAALNFSYAVLRATLARTLVSFGFLPAFGLFHQSEQNAFNLADDLIEPFRPFADHHIRQHYHEEPARELCREDKAAFVTLLHQDIALTHHEETGACTLLAGIEASISSLTHAIGAKKQATLTLPCLTSTLARARIAETETNLNE